MPRRRTLVLICCAILCGAKHSLACSCAEVKPPACQEAWKAAAVFAGTVTQFAATQDEHQFPYVKVHLTIAESFLGLTPESKEIDILTPAQGSACGFPFRRGQSYVVYADRLPDGALRTNHCLRTASLAEASDDLAYLRSLPTRKPMGEVTGVTFDSQTPRPADGAVWPWGTLPDIPVTIHSAQVLKTITTDSKGRFVVTELPPGRYTVTADTPGYWAGASDEVSVPAKGCAAVQINLNIDRGVQGRVVDPFGRPARNVAVDLVGTQNGLGVLQAESDLNGHYEFRRLPSGEYYLGVSLTSEPLPDHPYQRWYYPGISDFSQALPLLIGAGPKTLTVDLPLPEAQQEITLTGIVQWPDGRPAAHLDVFPEDPDFPNQLSMIRFTTDDTGKFTAKLFGQTTYRLYAVHYEPSSQKSTSAEPVTIVPNQLKEGTIIRLVLSHDGDLITPEMNRH